MILTKYFSLLGAFIRPVENIVQIKVKNFYNKPKYRLAL